MVDDPLDPPPPADDPPPAGPAVDSLTALALSASTEALHRSHRVVLGSEGAYWERNLVTGEVWFSHNFFAALGVEAQGDRHSIIALLHPDDQAPFARNYAAALERVGVFAADVRYRHRSGDYRWARIQARAWPDAQGRPERMVGMVTDVHEQGVAREELQQHRERLEQMVEERTASLESALAEAQRQREQAERANEAKSTFLAHMSHEIRTPLNGLLGLNELALREAHSDQQRRYLRLALQCGRGLLDMLNGVLDFSQLTAGGAPARSDPFDLAETLASSMRQVMPMARLKSLGMMFDYVGPVSRVVGDAQRIQQIAINLLTNAAKYTDSGHIALTARVQAGDGASCHAEIEVRDTGPGMAAETAARVFEPFVQGDESLARRHGGIGLGLPIARSLAHSMGGSLGLQTTVGEGACFRLALPLQAQPDAQPMDLRPAPGQAWLAYNRPIPAQWLATRLERLGWGSEILGGLPGAVAHAVEAAAGLRAAPDLLVLAEATLDSAAALDELRRHLPHTPVVLLVRPDWNQPDVEAAARANGMPLTFMPLTPLALLDLLSASGPPVAPPDSLPGDLGARADLDADVLIAEDNPVNQLIITEMVTSLGLRPRMADNGAEAVTACRAQPPKLVLMDLQMPEVDGIEATRQLCELQRLGQLRPFPIVALTAHATTQDRERCLAAGMQGFLTKPISLGSLRTELRRWVAV